MAGSRYVIAVVITVAQFGVAAMITTVTARAASGTLRRNRWIGIRTPSTMRSHRAWVAGHGAAQRVMPLFFVNAAVASALRAVGVVCQWPSSVMTAVGIAAFLTLIALGISSAIVAGRAARSAGSDVDDPNPPT